MLINTAMQPIRTASHVCSSQPACCLHPAQIATMGRGRDDQVHRQFEESIENDTRTGQHRKTPTYTCRHCGVYKRKKHALQDHKTHLSKCGAYQEHLHGRPQQQSLIKPPPSLNMQSKHVLDRKAAEAILFGGLPFTTFDCQVHPAMRAFHESLHPGYTPPSRQRIAGQLLDEIYDDIWRQVQTTLQSHNLLNFTIDESATRSNDRVFNTCANIVNVGSFHLGTTSMKDLNADVENLADLTKAQIHQAIQCESNESADYERVNSLCTDTCNVMRSLHRKLRNDPNFHHTFFVLCDSHGLQLLIADILGISPWKEIMSKVNIISTYFRKAKKALGLLRKHMDILHARSAFILSVITRWGTQYGVVRGVLRAMKPLVAFARDPAAQSTRGNSREMSKMGQKVMDLIRSGLFWQQVENIEALLRPIHLAQIQSESDSSTLPYVIDRWLQLRNELSSVYSAQDRNDTSILQDVFNKRFKKQTLPIH